VSTNVFANPANLPDQTMDQATFDKWMAFFIANLPVFSQELNATESSITMLASGGAFAIPFVIDLTSTANADPGNGKLRFNNATQGNSTSLYVDVLSSTGLNVSGLLSTLDASTSVVKGKIRLVKVGDATKYITFDVTARAVSAGHHIFTVTSAWGTSPSPFANNDLVVFFFDRTGDRGTQGPAGSIIRRIATGASFTGLTTDAGTTDMQTVTAQAGTLTINAPTGSAAEGQGLTYRIKDNGTARALVWNTIFRPSTELVLPGTTVAGKTMYVGFAYNAADAKWDLIATLNGI
jgi:hypothetical protein